MPPESKQTPLPTIARRRSPPFAHPGSLMPISRGWWAAPWPTPSSAPMPSACISSTPSTSTVQPSSSAHPPPRPSAPGRGRSPRDSRGSEPNSTPSADDRRPVDGRLAGAVSRRGSAPRCAHHRRGVAHPAVVAYGRYVPWLAPIAGGEKPSSTLSVAQPERHARAPRPWRRRVGHGREAPSTPCAAAAGRRSPEQRSAGSDPRRRQAPGMLDEVELAPVDRVADAPPEAASSSARSAGNSRSSR